MVSISHVVEDIVKHRPYLSESLAARSKKILAGTPAGRFVESNELLGGVFFLCDDRAASAVTGVILPIDAGFSAYSGV